MELTAQEVLGAYQVGLLSMGEARLLLGIKQDEENK
jgi:hypothetical protein